MLKQEQGTIKRILMGVVHGQFNIKQIRLTRKYNISKFFNISNI